ncbi:MAG: CHRD domain-containing protein [Alphaproteobacteria bacterium]|nr:CHRD domain-containing protein [Alphaproteobacteria bacterium]
MTHRIVLYAAAAMLALGCSVPAVASTLSLNAVLLGGNECIGGPTCAQGDLDAFGVASITLPNAATICFSILVERVDPPTAAHIHAGVATVNGGIVVPLAPPATGNPGASSGCVASPAGFNKALVKDPAAFYVNVHTGAFPNGAMRGQVF